MKKEHGYDLDKLQFIGEGRHGKIYKVDNDKCIKIFKRKQICQKEIETLSMAQKSILFPKLYDFGEIYIVREFIEGIELDKYLKNNPLTLELSENLIKIYEAFKEVGYKRQDTALLHIFIDSHNNLRLIDTALAMSKATKYPTLILADLKKLGLKATFLEHVKQLNPELYKYLIDLS